MKGKGKVEKGGKGNHLSSEDSPLQFPNLKVSEFSCPKYDAVLSEEDGWVLGADDLDALQLELDNLLADVAKRIRQIELEIQLVDGWIDVRGKDSYSERKDKVGMSPASYTGQLTPSTPLRSPSEPATPSGKRERSVSSKGSTADSKPSKRSKMEPNQLSSMSGKDKGKVQPSIPAVATAEAECEVKLSELMKTPRNLIQNRFWAMVEVYSGEVTKKDIEFLEEHIAFCENIDEYMRNCNQKSSTPSNDLANGTHNKNSRIYSRNHPSISTVLNNPPSTSNVPTCQITSKVNENEDEEDSSTFGLLTKRLIEGFIDDKSIKKSNSEIDVSDFASMPQSQIAKQLRISNPLLLEKKIRKELLELGILDFDDVEIDGDDADEVMCELRKQQIELRQTSQQNGQVLKHLLVEAKHELRKQELKAKIQLVDAEIVESYKRIQLVRSKKKQISKKDRDSFYKFLDDRKIMCRQLYAIYSAS